MKAWPFFGAAVVGLALAAGATVATPKAQASCRVTYDARGVYYADSVTGGVCAPPRAFSDPPLATAASRLFPRMHAAHSFARRGWRLVVRAARHGVHTIAGHTFHAFWSWCRSPVACKRMIGKAAVRCLIGGGLAYAVTRNLLGAAAACGSAVILWLPPFR